QDNIFIAVLSELLGKERKETEREKKEETAMAHLFNKGSSSANEMAEIWDDTALIRMYEESISSTYNTVAPGTGASKSAAKKKTRAQPEQESNGWSVNDRCVAPYEESPNNKLWFPAVITRIDPSSGTVDVIFDGYEGTETVEIEEIFPEESLEGGDEQREEEEEGEQAMEVSSHPSFSAAPAAGG
ncbi:hypothetical protein PENTCL1PPCAC_24561, partial [Pristionchus entomophagus]